MGKFIYIGEFAALATAFLWMLSSLCWTVAGERVGSLAVNVMRLLMALPMLMLCLWITEGELLPFSASVDAWFYLSISGIFGFFICDLLLFRSFLLIGPRLGMLILSLTPPMTALIGRFLLDERRKRRKGSQIRTGTLRHARLTGRCSKRPQDLFPQQIDQMSLTAQEI